MNRQYNIDAELEKTLEKTIRIGEEAGRQYLHFVKNLVEGADRVSKVIKEFETRFS